MRNDPAGLGRDPREDLPHIQALRERAEQRTEKIRGACIAVWCRRLWIRRTARQAQTFLHEIPERDSTSAFHGFQGRRALLSQAGRAAQDSSQPPSVITARDAAPRIKNSL